MSRAQPPQGNRGNHWWLLHHNGRFQTKQVESDGYVPMLDILILIRDLRSKTLAMLLTRINHSIFCSWETVLWDMATCFKVFSEAGLFCENGGPRFRTNGRAPLRTIRRRLPESLMIQGYHCESISFCSWAEEC
jgi:hypothetical protein